MEIKIILVLIFVLIMTAIAIQNPTLVVLQFFAWESPKIPLALVIILSIIIGLIIAGFISMWRQFRLGREIKRLEKVVERQNEELKAFRNMSITDTEEAGKGEKEE